MAKPTLHRALLSRVLVMGALLGVLGATLAHVQQREALESERARLAASLAIVVARAVDATADAGELQPLLQTIAAEAGLHALALVGGRPARVIASSEARMARRGFAESFGLSADLADARTTGGQWLSQTREGARLLYGYPVAGLVAREDLGEDLEVVIELDARDLQRELWARTATVAGFSVVLLGALAFFLRWVTQRHAVAPLAEMADAVERQAAGDTDVTVPTEFSTREFTSFGGLLNEMVRTRNLAHRDLQRSEAELRLLGQITRIADRAEDFDEALRSCCAQICRFMLWPLGHVYVRDEDDHSLLRPSNIWHISCPELAIDFVQNTSMVNFREGEDVSGRVLERKEPVWVEDCWAEEWFTRSAPGTSMIRAAAGFPIFMSGEVVAVLELFDVKPRPREVRPFALMHNIGLTIGHVLQRRQAHELLVRRNKELVEAMQLAVSATNAKSAFLANMSHEIRTPLTAIIGYAELLEGSVNAAERKDYTTTIQRNSEHLLQLISDILDVSKIEAGRLEVERIECVPSEIIQSVAGSMEPRAREKDLEFVLGTEGPVPEKIQTDPTRLNQVLLNLVSNAIKFTLRGRVELRLGLATPADDENPLLRFTIKDTGIGIRKEQLDKIFHPFSQADMSTTRRFGGTGLGLSISQNLIELMGGSLQAESVEGEGSLFSFTVETGPLDGVRVLDAPIETTTKGGAESQDVAVGRLDDLRVLLAEDGLDNQRLITKFLTAAGAKVEVAENGALACERVLGAADSGQPFDLVLMDMQMPVMDGYAATKKLRQQGYRGPVIALTANAMKGDREKCLAAGCDEFISKPVKRVRLTQAILEWIDRD